MIIQYNLNTILTFDNQIESYNLFILLLCKNLTVLILYSRFNI